MKSIQSNFKTVQKKNPLWSSYICFIETIKGRGYEMRSMREAFNKLVDKNDYVECEKKGILLGLRDIAQKS